tara:strand:+ start:4274 stop:6064 length:1791 start_codon:yes stop_codon:yes gene_type:complete
MPYKFNPFTGTLDDSTPGATGAQGPAGVVAAANSGTALLPGITFATDLNTGIYNPGADQLAISTGGSGRLFVDASGNINLGQASSALQSGGTGLTVYGASASEIKLLNSTTGAAATDGTALVTSNNDFTINNREAGSVIVGTSNTERLRIDSSGRLLVGASTATESAILQIQTPTTLSTTDDTGVRFANTSTKVYPTTLNFKVTAGLYENIEIGNSASITSGLNNTATGNAFLFTKSAGNTQDINNLRHIILDNRLNWTDLNTCGNYFGISNIFNYSGINANSRTSNLFVGHTNQMVLGCPDGATQTISFVIPYYEFLSITPAGSSTVNITNSFGQSLNMINSTAGTKTINITTHTFLTTYFNDWGMFSSGSPGTMTANITTMYGLRLRAPAALGTGNTLNITNNWGISQEWSSAKNWFAGASNQFPNITTTASGANAFLDSADSNRLYLSTSSLAYKRDVEDLDSSVADQILNLRPVWYRSKCETDCADWSWYGFIAEEVAEIDPRLVHYGYQKDAYELSEITETVELSPDDPRREDGIKTTEVTRQKRQLKSDAKQVPNGVAYERLVVPLLDIIKRQKSQLDSFEARLAALEGA